jgi:hypothetical protein
MAALLGDIMLSPNLRWTLSAQDWWWNFVFARVTPAFNSAHVFSYVSVPIVYFIAWKFTGNEYFSLAYAAFMATVHELIWILFTTLLIYTHGLNYPSLWAGLGFGWMIAFFGAVVIYIYKLKRVWIGFLVTFIFDAVWLLWNGFAISVTIFDVFGQASYAPTGWYYDVGANLFENLGWLALIPIFAWILWPQRNNIPRLREKYSEWTKHGWIK